MPGLNRTGPTGDGSMTGRQLGRCTGNEPGDSVRRSGNFRAGSRRGCGHRAGKGFGFRWGSPFEYNQDGYSREIPDETLLKNESELLKDQLSRIEKELERIQKGEK